MIQDIAGQIFHTAQVHVQEPPIGEGEYRAILGIFAVSLTLSIMVLIQMAMNM
ncbi:hypothetical protein [Parasphingorhabdus sp. NYA22]